MRPRYSGRPDLTIERLIQQKPLIISKQGRCLLTGNKFA